MDSNNKYAYFELAVRIATSATMSEVKSNKEVMDDVLDNFRRIVNEVDGAPTIDRLLNFRFQ